jgi:hypothetical protein
MTFRGILSITLLGLLTACGGGDGEPSDTSSPSTTSAPSSAPPTTSAPVTPSVSAKALPKNCKDPRLIAAMGDLIKGKPFGKQFDAADSVGCLWGKKIPTAGVSIALPTAKPKYEDFPEVEVPELSKFGVTAQSGGTEISVGPKKLYNQVFVIIGPQFRITVDQSSEQRRDGDLHDAAVAVTTWLLT